MKDIELYPTDYVAIKEDGDFLRFGNGQIIIFSDEREIDEEIKYSKMVRTTDLSNEKQKELKENIKKYQ